MAQVHTPPVNRQVEAANAAARPQAAPLDDVFERIRQCEHVGDYTTSLPLRERTLADLVRARDSQKSPEEASNAEALSGEIAFQAEELVKLYCCLSLDTLNRNDFSMGFDLLQKAQRLVEHGRGMLFSSGFEQLRVKARATVLNNLGLFYYRTGDYKASVDYLAEAHRLEAEVLGTAFSENPGATMLNLAQAHVACGNNNRAVPVLQCAIQVLGDQARHAAVTVQAEDAVNLMMHCMSLLGHCLEAAGDFNNAADTFAKAVERWKVRRMSATDAPAFENRLRELQEDMRRCQEKALRLPNIPLRATRPAKTIAARDKRGTKEHSHRLQLVCGHPEMQHERIVTSTLPATLPAPVWNAQPSVPGSGGPSATAVHGTHHQPQQVSSRTTPSNLPVATPQGMESITPENVPLPAGAVDVNLANNSRATPTTSRRVFTSAPGLAKIYQQLNPRFQEAFDSLAAMSRVAPPPPPSNRVFPETVLYGNHRNVEEMREQQRATVAVRKPNRNDYERPWSTQTSTPRPSSAAVTPLPVASSRPMSAPRGHTSTNHETSPRKPVRPQSGRPAAARQLRDNNSSPVKTPQATPLPATAILVLGGSVARAADDQEAAMSSADAPMVTSDGAELIRVGARDVLEAFARGKASELLVLAKSLVVKERLEIRLVLRHEEAARAQAEAHRMLERERAHMERELAEARLLAQSRRRISEPLAFTSSSRSLHQAVSDPNKQNADEEALHRTVRRMLTVHARCSLEKASSVHVTEELVEAVHHQQDETTARRHDASIVVLRFVHFCFARQRLEERLADFRSRAIAAFTSASRLRAATRRIEKFLRFVIEVNREKRAQFAAEEVHYRCLVAAVTAVTTHLRTVASTSLVAERGHRKICNATATLQACGRGYFDRLWMSFREREFASREARQLEHAGKVILLAMRRNVRIRKAEARWNRIESENMMNKRTYAATCIQSHWRRHFYGYPVALIWKENLAKRQLQERLRIEGERHAAAMLRSCVVLQRSYRMHLARRQLKYLQLLREHLRQKYFVSQMQTKAAATLQAFSRIVRAKGAARRLREMNAASARTRRLIFDMEQEEERSCQIASAVRLIQRAGRAFRRRRIRCHPREEALHGRWRPVRASECSSNSGDSARGQRDEHPRRFSRVEILDIPPLSIKSYPSSSATSTHDSPPMFDQRTSSTNFSRISDASITSSLERAIQETTALVRQLKPADSTDSLSSRKSSKDAVAMPSDVVRVNACAVIVRFFRVLRRHRLSQKRRDDHRHDTIVNEAARFIQDSWRRYLGKRRLGERQQLKSYEQQLTIACESALMIQAAYRRYLRRRIQKSGSKKS